MRLDCSKLCVTSESPQCDTLGSSLSIGLSPLISSIEWCESPLTSALTAWPPPMFLPACCYRKRSSQCRLGDGIATKSDKDSTDLIRSIHLWVNLLTDSLREESVGVKNMRGGAKGRGNNHARGWWKWGRK
jgi:hypothetical protein